MDSTASQTVRSLNKRAIAGSRRTVRAMLASLALLSLVLVGCGDQVDSEKGAALWTTSQISPGDNAGDTAGASPDGSDEAALAAEAGRDRSDFIDPCAGRTGAEPTQCNLVAWVDVNGDGSDDPVAVYTTGGPALGIATVVNEDTLTYESHPDAAGGSASHIGPAMGQAGLADMDANRNAAFVGAFDLLGNDQPQLVLWTDKDASVDLYRVLNYQSGHLVPVHSPTMGMYSGGATWSHHLYPEGSTLRCTGDRTTPIEIVMAHSPGEPSSVRRYAVTHDQRGYTETASFSTTQSREVLNRPLGVDCPDLAEHTVESYLRYPGDNAQQGQHCVLSYRVGGQGRTDDVGSFTEAAVTSGQVDCAAADKLWLEYVHRTVNGEGDSATNAITIDGDRCITDSDSVSDQMPKSYGSCSAGDDSWAFEVVLR